MHFIVFFKFDLDVMVVSYCSFCEKEKYLPALD